jgi:hypothetical protein
MPQALLARFLEEPIVVRARVLRDVLNRGLEARFARYPDFLTREQFSRIDGCESGRFADHLGPDQMGGALDILRITLSFLLRSSGNAEKNEVNAEEAFADWMRWAMDWYHVTNPELLPEEKQKIVHSAFEKDTLEKIPGGASPAGLPARL